MSIFLHRAGIMSKKLVNQFPSTIAYVGTNGATNNSNSYTFNTEPVGAEVTDRRILVGIYTGNEAITSATCNTNAMTRLASFEPVGNRNFEFYIIDEDTGTTANFVFNTDGSNATQIRFFVWNVFGGVVDTPHDTDETALVAGTPATFPMSLTCPDNSSVAAITIARDNSDGTTNDVSWVGATVRANEDGEGIGNIGEKISAADATVVTPTTLNVTASYTLKGSNSGSAACCLCL